MSTLMKWIILSLSFHLCQSQFCSSCSVTCGGGTRSCIGIISQSCNTQCCPVNGGWSTWSSWNTCPVTCEGTSNNQYRSRSCTRPARSCSGADCSGADTEYQTCNSQCCPVDGGWATWEEWYACPVTCGTGTQNRYRDCSDPLVYCSGADCPLCSGLYCGNAIQRDDDPRTCNDFTCHECGNREIGYGAPSLYTATLGSNSGYGILAESGFYEATCCGVIKSWEFYASRAGELHLMIWRKSETTYTLVGKNIYTVPSNAIGHTVRYSPRELDRLTIKDGDILGWYAPGSEIIRYSSDASYPHNYRMTTMSNVDEGNTYAWSSIGYTHDRAYAIRAFTDENTAPFFTNLQRQIQIYDDEPISANIYRVTYFNGDSRDELTWTFTSTTTAISFDTSSEYIYLTAIPAVGTYTMTFGLTDPCGNSASGSLTIKVSNTPVQIINLPNSVTLHESIQAGQLLHTLEVYDRQATDSISCVLTSTTPTVDYFSVERISGNPNFGVYLQPKSSFDYNSHKKYQLLISCDDGKNTATTGFFFVYIQKNHPPQFVNIPASINVSASSTLIGDLLFNVQMTDAENDTMIFSMTTDPSGGPFEIKDYGDIVTTDDFPNIFEPAYNLEISVSDNRTTVGPRTLSVQITNINDKPVISNLPLSYAFLIEENSPIGTTLYHVRVRDLDTSDTHLIYGAFVPTTGLSYFSMSADGYLTISSDLDYESIANKNFDIVVTATDSKNTATATMSVTVTDQNEAPVFHQTGYSVEKDEAAQNTAFPSAGFVVDEPDAGDTLTYWLDCGNDTWRFTMNSANGDVTYAYDYDLDKLLTTQYDCLVRGRDGGFNTATTSLVIKIKDLNDNPPYFNQTQYAFYITPYESVGTEIGNVTAYDIDVSEFGTLTYQLDMTAYSVLYIQINENGTLYVNEPLDSQFTNGDVMTLTLTAIDYGGLSTPVTIWIVFPAENTTTTSTTPVPVKFLTSPTNTLWFTAVGILTLFGVGGLFYFCTQYWHSIDCLRTTSKLGNKTEGKNVEQKDSKPKNKLKSIDTQRPPGNPIFDKNRGRNSTTKFSTPPTNSYDRSSLGSLASTNIPSYTGSNSEDVMSQKTISGKVFNDSNSRLYNEKQETKSPLALDI